MEFPAPTAPFVVALLVGKVKKQKLTNVTTGMFTGCSMIFHTQEGERYAEHNGEMKPIGLYNEYISTTTLINTFIYNFLYYFQFPSNQKENKILRKNIYITYNFNSMHIIDY